MYLPTAPGFVTNTSSKSVACRRRTSRRKLTRREPTRRLARPKGQRRLPSDQQRTVTKEPAGADTEKRLTSTPQLKTRPDSRTTGNGNSATGVGVVGATGAAGGIG